MTSARPVPAAGEQLARTVPVLETERLILRAWRKADFRPYHAIVSDPVVMRHFGGHAMGQEECWRRLCAAIGGWAMVGYGTWALVDRADGRLIGNVGLFNAWREMEPQFGDEPEMGWILASEAHGRGLAYEACRAVLDWADRALDPTAIWAIIAPENAPSMKLAEKLGFERLADSVYKDEPTAVLRRSPAAAATAASATA